MADKPCSVRCQKATGYRCQCSCGGSTHAALSSVPMRRAAPTLSGDLDPDPRYWTRSPAHYLPTTLPLPFDIPTDRQMNFSEIAAIWPQPERAA